MNVQGLTRVLCSSVAHRTPLPQALGQRAADLAHKTSCVCSSLSFETSGAGGLDNFLQAGASGTFDLGVEYGIADNPYSEFFSHVQPLFNQRGL